MAMKVTPHTVKVENLPTLQEARSVYWELRKVYETHLPEFGYWHWENSTPVKGVREIRIVFSYQNKQEMLNHAHELSQPILAKLPENSYSFVTHNYRIYKDSTTGIVPTKKYHAYLRNNTLKLYYRSR